MIDFLSTVTAGSPAVQRVDFASVLHALSTLKFDTPIKIEDERASLEADGVPFFISFTCDHRFLSIRASWDSSYPSECCKEALFPAANWWNRTHFYPTVYFLDSPEETIIVCGDFIADTRCGLTRQQILDNVAMGISSGLDAIAYMKHTSNKLLGACPCHLPSR